MTDRDYRDTVFLPTTSFPMRGDLPKREPAMLQRWEDTGLFAQLRAQGAERSEKFILHDGPPYANGNIHIGHALNKILKDVINRARQMAGYDAYYIPGWDCHGLPIEWQIEEKYRKEGRDKDSVPILQFRAECRAHAQKWLDVQAEEFKRLGIFGDWANRYATMDFGSEATIATEIHRFAQNGALYRGLRPVLWSVVEKTALAEAEVEYADHTSTTIWVRFPVVDGQVDFSSPTDNSPLHTFDGTSVVIWTTTPWTIPGNRAIAYGNEIDYAHIRVDAVSDGSLARPGERLLVANQLLPKFLTDVGITLHHVLQIYPGARMGGIECAHPLRDAGRDYYIFSVPLLAGDFVTTDQGTGFVHMAPAHGEDDFALCKAHGIDVPETVADDGTYFPWVPLFPGVHVFKAAKPVCDALIAAGALVKQGTVTHSYPHSWRSKAPLIFRATPQWFIRMDGPEHMRDQALTAIANTAFVPEAGRTRLSSMVANRPDWCISRQRAWGVPIAIFTNKRTGEILRDPDVFARTIEAFRTEGADAWYASPPARFLGNTYDANDYEQVHDIVDVWFESGCTNVFTLLNRNLPWPADLYLEGSDQHRGWFQSSLLEGIGARGQAPFKAILTHGFTLDEQGRKMSKSIGNTMAPQKITDEYGADILRLWVMNTDITEDQRIGKEILKQQAELYRRLRNTLRWLLGSLQGWSEQERVSPADMPLLERYILDRLAQLGQRIDTAVQNHDWAGVYPDIHTFCSADLSAFYFDIRKDTLYCDRPDNHTRRACRTMLDLLHRCLCTWLAPVLCFTAEEAWSARFGDSSSVHLQRFPDVSTTAGDASDIKLRVDTIRERRSDITTAVEKCRQSGAIGSSLQAAVTIPAAWAATGAEDWAEIAIVSSVQFSAETDAVTASPAPGTKCARCWRVLPEVGTVHTHPTLCLRCSDAVDHLDAPESRRMTQRARTLSGITLAVLVLAADQASKWAILRPLHLPERGDIPVLPPALDFAMVWNHGVTFGLLQSGSGTGQLILAAVAVAVVAGLAVWLRSAATLPTACAIGAIGGGALGNVMDRARYGMVVDFIHVHWAAWDPFPFVFNVGDSAIVVGVAVLLLESLIPARASLQPPPPKA